MRIPTCDARVRLRNVECELHLLIRSHSPCHGACVEASLVKDLQSIGGLGEVLLVLCSLRGLKVPGGPHDLRSGTGKNGNRIGIGLVGVVCLHGQRGRLNEDRGKVPAESDIDARGNLVVGVARGRLCGLGDGNTTGSGRARDGGD